PGLRIDGGLQEADDAAYPAARQSRSADECRLSPTDKRNVRLSDVGLHPDGCEIRHRVEDIAFLDVLAFSDAAFRHDTGSRRIDRDVNCVLRRSEKFINLF